MKVMIVRVLEMLGMPFRIKDENLSTYACGKGPTLDDWCKKRSICLTRSRSDLFCFRNIILRSEFTGNYASASDKIILLTLIGMIH